MEIPSDGYDVYVSYHAKSTDVNSISKALEGTCFRLSPGYKLGLKIAEPGDYLGDNSFFYIYEGNRNCKDWNVFDHLLVEKSEVGAWQAYLMYTSPRIMPAYWHGLYENSKFIFIEDDLRDVPILKNRDFTFLKKMDFFIRQLLLLIVIRHK